MCVCMHVYASAAAYSDGSVMMRRQSCVHISFTILRARFLHFPIVSRTFRFFRAPLWHRASPLRETDLRVFSAETGHGHLTIPTATTCRTAFFLAACVPCRLCCRAHTTSTNGNCSGGAMCVISTVDVTWNVKCMSHVSAMHESCLCYA